MHVTEREFAEGQERHTGTLNDTTSTWDGTMDLPEHGFEIMMTSNQPADRTERPTLDIRVRDEMTYSVPVRSGTSALKFADIVAGHARVELRLTSYPGIPAEVRWSIHY